jgi:hypothetical protein
VGSSDQSAQRGLGHGWECGPELTRAALRRLHHGLGVLLWLLPAQSSHQAGVRMGSYHFMGHV